MIQIDTFMNKPKLRQHDVCKECRATD